jgi:heme exporter protein A
MSPSGAAFLMREPDLVGEGLACRRGERLIFRGLSFRLAAGGFLLVTGANGSGKSSLLRLVASLIAPEAGRLLWGTSPVAGELALYRARLDYVGHLDAIKPALSPREILRFWAALRGVGRADPVERALSSFALEPVADCPCRWLSAGQRRRLALARLDLAAAPIWLLDEPFTGLDRDNQDRLERAIAAHRDLGGRVMLATHQPLALAGAQSLALDDFAPSLA